MEKKNKAKSDIVDLLLILTLLILAYIPWQQLPQLVIRGDGFVYLISQTIDTFFNKEYFFSGFELSAVVLGSILPKLYKTNMELYFYTSLSVMMLINVLFYILLRVITKHKLISFFGALMFAVNYFGNWDMYSQHCYCFFVERIVGVPFILTAFIFLHLYLEKNKLRHYVTSLGFYFFGIGIAHFGVLFSAPYFLYPFFWTVFQRKPSKKSMLKGLLVGLSFFAISAFFVLAQKISYGQIGPTQGIVQYFLNPAENKYPEKIVRQFVYWSQYEPIIKNFDIIGSYKYLDVKNAQDTTTNIVILYFIVALIVYKKLPHMKSLLFTTILGTISIFFLNSWFGQYDVLNQPESNRYLYFPTFLLVLFWTLFLLVLWQGKSLLLKVFVVFFVFIVYLLNWLLLHSSIKDVLIWDRSTKVTYDYMTEISNKLPKNSLVVAGYPEVGVYESVFFTEQLGNGEVTFIGEENPYRDWKKIATMSAHVIKLQYFKKCDCVKEKIIK